MKVLGNTGCGLLLVNCPWDVCGRCKWYARPAAGRAKPSWATREPCGLFVRERARPRDGQRGFLVAHLTTPRSPKGL